MKVGDLVRLKDYPQFSPVGLIVSTERRPGTWPYTHARVQWLGRNGIEYRTMNELEVVND